MREWSNDCGRSRAIMKTENGNEVFLFSPDLLTILREKTTTTTTTTATTTKPTVLRSRENSSVCPRLLSFVRAVSE